MLRELWGNISFGNEIILMAESSSYAIFDIEQLYFMHHLIHQKALLINRVELVDFKSLSDIEDDNNSVDNAKM